MCIELYLFPVIAFIFDDKYMADLLNIGQGVKM